MCATYVSRSEYRPRLCGPYRRPRLPALQRGGHREPRAGPRISCARPALLRLCEAAAVKGLGDVQNVQLVGDTACRRKEGWDETKATQSIVLEMCVGSGRLRE